MASDFAQSPIFFPILLAAVGAWALSTVVAGVSSGQIEPFVQGIYDSYERQSQPKRFWASMGWNGFLGCSCLFFAYTSYEEVPLLALKDSCYERKDAVSPTDQLLACNQLITTREDDDDLADLLAARGSAYFRMDDYSRAKEDYGTAVRLDPSDDSSLYNLGLVGEQLNDQASAIANYDAAILVNPKNMDAYFNRGVIFLNMRKFDESISDLSQAHSLKPDDPWPIANRGLAYAWKGDIDRASRDFSIVRKLDPSNHVMLSGEAIISMSAGDLPATVSKLTALLKSDPNNLWALRTRAQVYEQLDQVAEADADKAELARRTRSKILLER